MLSFIRDWQRDRILRRHGIRDTDWHNLLRSAPVLERRDERTRRRLRDVATLLMHEKDFLGAGGLEPDDRMCLRVAAFAALPVVELGLDWYGNFHSFLLYPEQFVVPERTWEDEFGIVHTGDDVLSGEAWDQGGIILAWSDVERSGRGSYNVVVHECAHKLDMLDGTANGRPPLHRGMDPAAWTGAFTHAWDALHAQLDAGDAPWLDPYAAEDPAEFFSVCSETFFEDPAGLHTHLGGVYDQLAAFYRQDPAAS